MPTGYFPQRTILNNNFTKFIIKAFQDSFTEVSDKSSTSTSGSQASKASAVNIENDSSLTGVARRTATTILKGLGDVVKAISNGNEGEIYRLGEENIEMDDGAGDYFTKFKSNFHVGFIRPASIQQDDHEQKLPDGKAGNLLLIEELIRRIVARILSNEANVRSPMLIEILNKFIQKLQSATREQKIALGLLTDGKTFIGTNKDDLNTICARYLFSNEYEDNSGQKKQGFGIEINSLKVFIDENNNLIAFRKSLKDALEASRLEECYAKQRIIIALKYILKPDLNLFPIHILHEAVLDKTIIELVNAVFTQLQLPPSNNKQLVRQSKHDESTSLVMSLIQYYRQQVNIPTDKAPFLEMLENNINFEFSRRKFIRMFKVFGVFEQIVGDLIILSGGLNVETVNKAIECYIQRGLIISNKTQGKLRRIAAISNGRPGIWDVVNQSSWKSVISSLKIAADPIVQSRICQRFADGIEELYLVDKMLRDNEFIEKKESIINGAALGYLMQGLTLSVSGNLPLCNELQAGGFRVSGSIPLSVRSLTNGTNDATSTAVARSSSYVITDSTKENEQGLIANIKTYMVEYAFKHGYKFNLNDLDSRVRLDSMCQDAFKITNTRFDKESHQRRIDWMFSVFSFMQSSDVLQDLRTLFFSRINSFHPIEDNTDDFNIQPFLQRLDDAIKQDQNNKKEAEQKIVTLSATPVTNDSVVKGRAFELVYELQNKLIKTMLDETMKDDIEKDSEQLRQICCRLGSINEAALRESTLCVDLVKKILNQYSFVATWTRGGAWFTSGLWWWRDYQRYQLRFFYASIIEALEKISIKENQPVDNDSRFLFFRMINILLASFLEKMVGTLTYHKEAESLLLTVLKSTYPSRFTPMQEVLKPMPGREGEFSVALSLNLEQQLFLMQKKLAETEAERDTVKGERDTARAEIKVLTSKTEALAKQLEGFSSSAPPQQQRAVTNNRFFQESTDKNESGQAQAKPPSSR